MAKSCLLLGLAILLSGQFHRLAASEFYHADELFGAANSRIKKMSADGSTFVGFVYDAATAAVAWDSIRSSFIWSGRAGLTYLEKPGFAVNVPIGVSPDGSRAWTWSWDDAKPCWNWPLNSQGEIVEWTPDGRNQEIGISISCTPQGGFTLTDPVAALPDGQVFVGRQEDSYNVKRYSATADGYREEIIARRGLVLFPQHVSPDGTVVVGWFESVTRDFGTWLRGTWRWSEETGEFVILDVLPGYPHSEAGRFGGGDIASVDGSVVVGGVFGDGDEGSQAFRWTVERGMVGLGFLEGDRDSHAFTVSTDGEVVLGSSGGDYWSGDTPSSLRHAFVWDEANGMRDLQRVLVNEFGLGDGLDGLRLSSAKGISENRQVLYGDLPADDFWIAMLDRPLVAFTPSDVVGDLTNDRVVDIQDIDVLRSAIRDGSTELPYDLDGSGTVEIGDLTALVHGALNTWFGDANLDGEFNSGDLVTVFQAGQYEDETANNSTWATGDWNADGDFTTSDLVAAFQDGGYEQGPRAAINSVPEPSSLMMTLLIALALMHRRRQTASL